MHSLRLILITFLAINLIACKKADDVATVNGRNISKAEFETFLNLKHSSTQDEKRKQALLDQYLEREALAEVMEEQELLDPLAIQVKVNEARKDALINDYFDKFLKNQINEEAIVNYYNTHGADYEENKIHIAHILLRTNRMMTEEQRQEKLAKAQEAYNKAKANEDFTKLVETYSEDSISAKKGGDLGLIRQGVVSKEFSDKIFSMKAGEISEPIETPFGYHIVKVIEEPKIVKKPLTSVKSDIRYKLRTQMKADEMQRLLALTKIEKHLAEPKTATKVEPKPTEAATAITPNATVTATPSTPANTIAIEEKSPANSEPTKK